MDLEKLATSSIEREIAMTDLLSSFINSGDKEPCWDGHIYIHEDKLKTKKNIKKVAVQVKGKAVQKRNVHRKISYPVSYNDLHAYMMNGGTVFFVVYLDSTTGDTLQVYCAGLLPVMIKEILDANKGKQKISIKFHKFPVDSKIKTEFFLNFYEDAQKQASFAGKALPSIGELAKQGLLESINISYVGLGACPDTRFFPKILEGQSLTLYAVIKGGTAPIPVNYCDEISHVEMRQNKDIEISVRGHIYYTAVETVTTVDTIEHHIGSSVILSVPNSDDIGTEIPIHLHINLNGTLTEQIKSLEFIIAMVQNKGFHFGDTELPVEFPEAEIQRMKKFDSEKMLNNRKKIKELLDSLNVKKDLELSKCTEDDLKKLYQLLHIVGEHEIVQGNFEDGLVQVVKIANIALAVVYEKVKNGYQVSDYFGKHFDVKWSPDDTEPVDVSQFHMMSTKDYLTLDNLNLKRVVEDFCSIPPSGVHVELSNNCMLTMLKAYDKSGNREFLDAARQMNNWLEKQTEFLPTQISALNRLQIERRERPLKFEEKSELYSIANNAIDKLNQVGAFLLLDEQEKAKALLETIDEDKQSYFKSFPIYRFCKDTEEVEADGQTENADSEQG